jgi:hypothetical protein
MEYNYFLCSGSILIYIGSFILISHAPRLMHIWHESAMFNSQVYFKIVIQKNEFDEPCI